MEKKNIILSWSSGKDAALALYYLKKENVEVKSLFTTINKAKQRITMHGVHTDILKKQVDCLQYPIEYIELPEDISIEKYNKIMGGFLLKKSAHEPLEVVYGDIFLEDLRNYRDTELSQYNIKAHYPLWKKETKPLAIEIINLGFKAIVVAVSSEKLDKSFVGREYNMEFINSLPSTVDPCGENGEFHTFVYDGPIFSHPVEVELGDVIYKKYEPSKNDDCFCDDSNTPNWDLGFWFCDLTLPK